MPELERRTVLAEVRIEERDGKKLIRGTGAVFFDPDDPGTEFSLWPGMKERIMPSAFDEALKRPDDVRGLFNHDANQILGRNVANTMTLSKSKRALDYIIDPPDSPNAANVIAALERGDVTGSSFSFTLAKGGQRWYDEEDEEIREITNVTLFDVGPVTFPAYTATDAGYRDHPHFAEARAAWQEWQNTLQAARRSAKARNNRARAVEVETQIAGMTTAPGRGGELIPH